MSSPRTPVESDSEDKNHDNEETKPTTENKGTENGASSKLVPDGSHESIVVDVAGSLAASSTVQASASSTSSDVTFAPTRKRNTYTNPPGTLKQVHASDNPEHSLKDWAQVGNPDESKLRFKLRLENGGWTKAFRFESRDSPQWDNEEWVSELNKWRTKILKRYFRTEDAGHNQNKTGPRVRWSHKEIENLRMSIRKYVRCTGTHLTGKDWAKLTELHNERFEGKAVRVGEKLAGGKLAASEQIIQKRSQAAMTALFAKFEDLKTIVVEEIAAFGTSSPEEKLGSDGSSSDSDGSDFSDVIGAELFMDDSSDGEDEGRRPVGQPIGGVLVEAT